MQLRPLVVRDVSGKLTLSKRQSATKERTGAREYHLFLWSSRSCCSQGQKIVGGPTGGSVHVTAHMQSFAMRTMTLLPCSWEFLL